MDALPNLSSYEMFSLVIIPFSLFFFGFDFLRDKEITKNETKIGIIQYIHHLAFSSSISGLIATFFLSSNIPFITFLTILSIIMQGGWLINDDYCWLTRYGNNTIGTKCKNRKWIAEIDSLVKHYIRGDDWAYSDARETKRTKEVIISNGLILMILIKIIIKNKMNG